MVKNRSHKTYVNKNPEDWQTEYGKDFKKIEKTKRKSCYFQKISVSRPEKIDVKLKKRISIQKNK